MKVCAPKYSSTVITVKKVQVPELGSTLYSSQPYFESLAHLKHVVIVRVDLDDGLPLPRLRELRQLVLVRLAHGVVLHHEVDVPALPRVGKDPIALYIRLTSGDSDIYWAKKVISNIIQGDTGRREKAFVERSWYIPPAGQAVTVAALQPS